MMSLNTNFILDHSSISDSKNSKRCETTPSSSVQGNEAEISDGLSFCK